MRFAVVAMIAGCSTGPLPDEHASMDGLDIVYHVAGNGPIALVHPGGPGIEWRYARMPELERAMTVVYIEPIGTGASARLADPDGYTLHAYAESIEAVRRAVADRGQTEFESTGADRVVLIGHSHGGLAAMQYAAEHADHLRGLVLYSTSAVRDKDWEADVDTAVESFRSASWFAVTAVALKAALPPADGERCPRLQAIAPFYFADWEHRKADLAPMVAELRCWPISTKHDEPHDDLRPRLAHVRVPTLVIAGRRDWLFPEKWARVTAGSFPGAEVVILDESGHFAHVEQPREFASAVTRFVAKLQ
jgi:proline iminopeptidase